MNTQKLYVTICVSVESDLSLEELIDEFGSECEYDFPSTENVKVLNQEWLDTSTQNI